jgi:hypothetical protein
MRARVILAFLLAGGLAHAQAQPQADAPPPPAEPPPPTTEEIEKALRADEAQKAKSVPKAATPTATPQPAAQSSGGGWGSVARFVQSLNPDLSAIVDFAGGWYSNDKGTVKADDDPKATGFTAQEIEVALQAVVDPYFRADIFLTVPNLRGFEVEEAYLTTTNLPANFQIKAGIFRAPFGRVNTQHLHLQDFTRRPGPYPQFLGIDGLRAPGLEVNWLVPRIPFYLLLTFAALSAEPADPDLVLQTFGGGERWDFTYVANAKAFWDLTEASSLYVGLSWAHGKTSQSTSKNVALPSGDVAIGSPAPTIYDNWYDNLYGADVYFKWKPPNVSRTWASVAWQTEYFLRQIPDFKMAGRLRPQVEGGLYTQLVVQAHRRWFIGLRGEALGIPQNDNVKRELATALSLTWQLSEFSRIRLYGEARFPLTAGVKNNGAAFVQIEASIGAHGAHPF